MDKTDLIEEALRAIGMGTPLGADRFRPDVRRDDKDHGSTASSVRWLLSKSPRLALARAIGIDFVPYVFQTPTTIQPATNDIPHAFTSSGPMATHVDEFPASNPGQILGSSKWAKIVEPDVIVQNIDVDLQFPKASYDELWSLNNWFIPYANGLRVRFKMTGKQPFKMDYVPLRALNKFCSPHEPWVMLEEQQVSYTLGVALTAKDTPLPVLPCVVTVTFIGKTPATDDTFRISQGDALDCLEKLGYEISNDTRSTWLDTL